MIEITSDGNISSFIGLCSEFETNATAGYGCEQARKIKKKKMTALLYAVNK
jgi:hypothetical protein